MTKAGIQNCRTFNTSEQHLHLCLVRAKLCLLLLCLNLYKKKYLKIFLRCFKKIYHLISAAPTATVTLLVWVLNINPPPSSICMREMLRVHSHSTSVHNLTKIVIIVHVTILLLLLIIIILWPVLQLLLVVLQVHQGVKQSVTLRTPDTSYIAGWNWGIKNVPIGSVITSRGILSMPFVKEAF